MARVEKLPLLTQKVENKKPFARTIPGRISAAIFGVAAGLAGSAIENAIDQNTVAQSNPITRPTAVPTESTKPTATVTASPTETPKPTETLKTLPDIINSTTVKMESFDPNTEQKMVDDAKASGEFKFPLPNILENSGISIKEISNKAGQKFFAITSDKPGDFDLPALMKGKVIQLDVGKPGDFSRVIIQTDSGDLLGYYFPTPGSSQVKEGEILPIGQSLASFKFSSDSNEENFSRYLIRQYIDAPKNTIAVIGIGNINARSLSVSLDNILRTPQGSVVVTPNK